MGGMGTRNLDTHDVAGLADIYVASSLSSARPLCGRTRQLSSRVYVYQAHVPDVSPAICVSNWLVQLLALVCPGRRPTCLHTLTQLQYILSARRHNTVRSRVCECQRHS